MRLSEKTFELNFCNQFERIIKKEILWFGLTQKEESMLGFDACTNVNGYLFIFQFKASNYYKKSRRKFYTTHKQLVNLQKLAKSGLSVYYVLPNIGETVEMIQKLNLFKYTWFLDVLKIGNLRKPNTKREMHYIYINPPKAEIHSEICKTNVIQITEIMNKIEKKEIRRQDVNIESLRNILQNLGRNTVLTFIEE